MVRIIWSPKSLRQIREISEYIAGDSKPQAFQVVGRLISATKRLEIFPESDALISEETKHAICEIRVLHYRIFYQLQENNSVVRIVAVVHGARRLTDEMIDG